MIRGLVYGTIGGAFGMTWPGLANLHSWPLLTLLWWPVVFVLGAPLLLIAAIPVQWLQRILQGRIRGVLFLPLAIFFGCPFGVLACMLVQGLFGMTGTLWTTPEGSGFLIGALIGGAGLGLGCVQTVGQEP